MKKIIAVFLFGLLCSTSHDVLSQSTFLENKLTQIFNDTGRTGFLLDADFIAHIHVNDTVSTTETSYGLTTQMVLVNSQIVDMIKGKKVFACADMFSAHGKDGVKPQTIS